MLTIIQFLTFGILAWRRKKSGNDYIKFQKFQADEIIKELSCKGVNINCGKFLELGCGEGGYSKRFSKYIDDFSVADIRVPQKLLESNPNINFLSFDFEKDFPIKDKTFDMVFSASVIEHIKERKHFLGEINRILKDSGTLILTFPPFYTPVGGHIFKPFHYFGEKLACKLTSYFKNHTANSYGTAYGSWGLYILKLSDVEKLITISGFKIKKEWVRYSPINFTKIPFLREVLSWQVHFLCEKSRKS